MISLKHCATHNYLDVLEVNVVSVGIGNVSKVINAFIQQVLGGVIVLIILIAVVAYVKQLLYHLVDLEAMGLFFHSFNTHVFQILISVETISITSQVVQKRLQLVVRPIQTVLGLIGIKTVAITVTQKKH